MRYAFLLLIALIVAVLGWGYWHVTSHAHVTLYVSDVALKNDRQLYGDLPVADLEFKDAAGALLARARIDRPMGFVAVQHPVVGDCRREEVQASGGGDGLTAWRRCFETRARWFPTWIRRVRSAGVRVPNCAIEQAPVSLYVDRDDWWLWWVPLPHVGGAPYTYFTLSVWVDSRECRGVSPVR